MSDDIYVTITEADPIYIQIEGGNITNHNLLPGLQGGAVDEYYHLIAADYTELTEWLDDVTLGSNGVTTIPQLVLEPSADAIEAIEGGMFYNSGDKAVYVCTDI
jgi:hypothetical protein